MQQTHERSLDLTTKSIVAYKALGAQKKALRSELNLLVDQAHLDPNKNRLADLFPILAKAKRLGDMITASSCYHSISHEYECLGAYRNALSAVNRAIALSFRFHLTGKICDYVAHKVDLLVKIDRKSEAQEAFELLFTFKTGFAEKAHSYLISRYPWLKRESTYTLISVNEKSDPSPSVPAAYWLDKVVVVPQAGSIEEQFLALISRRPHDRQWRSQRVHFGRRATGATPHSNLCSSH